MNVSGLQTELKACRLCGHPHLYEVFDLGVMANASVFPKTADEPVTEGPLRLIKCEVCNLVQLDRNYPRSEIDAGAYGYRSGLNKSMVGHLLDLRDKIMRWKPDATSIMDIGANDATFLKAFPDHWWKMAYEPNYHQFKNYYTPDIDVRDVYFDGHAEKVDVITTIAMLYDLEDIMRFALDVSKCLEDDGIWVTEQSYLPTMLRKTAYDTICHEHLEYYGLAQIDYMAQWAGFEILHYEFTKTNGGSVIAVLRRGSGRLSKDVVLGEQYSTSRNAFQEFERRIEYFREKLLQECSKYKIIHGMGASTKGNVILQHCRPPITHIAEINDDKIGRMTPGTHIPIISEEESFAMDPDAYVVLPWHFKIPMERRYPDRKLIFPL